MNASRPGDESPIDADIRTVDLRTRQGPQVIAVDEPAPRLSWRLTGTRPGIVQTGYEIEIAERPDFASATSSGLVTCASPLQAPWPAAPLASREERWCRVRAWTDRGRTLWSEPLKIETGLIDRRDWIARPISPPGNVGQSAPAPAPLVRRRFALREAPARARLFVTALGVHATTINGAPVSGDLLEPGWTAYRDRLLYAVHDVTDLLVAGENVLAAAIGDGWWRGDLTWMAQRCLYGDTTALLAQLEIEHADGTVTTIATDSSWRGATGGLLAADLYQGSTMDYRCEPAGWRLPGFDDRNWDAVTTLDLPAGLEVRTMAGVRVVETRGTSLRRTDRGTLLIDCGQNLTGWLRIVARGPAGAQIEVRHAEVLDDDGLLYTAALRKARATDHYVLDGRGAFDLEPQFTFHGFRFAEITAAPGVEIDRVDAVVISSDVAPTGTFECSEPLLEALWNNICWSQRGNLLALPTDCPQRDERMGWTGDIQVFAQTACMNSDVDAFLASWLRDLALEQRDDGCVPVVVPNVIQGHEFEFGSVGWGDAATLVPLALYEAYGDVHVLREQFGSMTAWVDWCASRLSAGNIWEGDFQLGDWLDPNAPPDAPHKATTSPDYIASAYLAHSSSAVATAARILGLDEAAAHYGELSLTVADATWRKWREHALTTQTGCAMAIEFAIAPEEEHGRIGQALADLVDAGEGRIATGFLGTPLVLSALTRCGFVDAAYRLLLNPSAPGWLYQVLHGATTVWERWDAIREDGSIHPGDMSVGEGASMMSFNHYAYGAVAAWFYRTLAGIAPTLDAPGYTRINFAPRPGGGITHAAASIDSAMGRASIAWSTAGAVLDVDLTVPPGATATFDVPPGWRANDPPGVADQHVLGSGRHRLSLEKTVGTIP